MSGEFPSNSRSSRTQDPAPEQKKNIESVVTNDVEKRKKSLFKRFAELMIGGDSRNALQYVIMEVLVPQAKEMVNEAASQGFERLIYGESSASRRRIGGARPNGSGTPYNRYAVRGNNPIGRSNNDDRRPVSQPRSQNIDDILLATRVEAETVLDRMYDLLKEYESVTVSDLNSLVGLSSNYTDQKWGWTDLQGSEVRRTRDGYILVLPRTTSLD